MNPEIQTSEFVQEHEASSIFHSFRIKWKISHHAFVNRRFFDSYYVPRPVPKSIQEPLDSRYQVIENSKLFSFRDIKMHPFSLLLMMHKDYESFHVKLLTNEPRDGPKLEYAFTSFNERLYHLNMPDKTVPTYLQSQEFENKIIYNNTDPITIMCGINAVSTVSYSPPTEIVVDEDDHYIFECSLPRDLPLLARPTSWSTFSCSSSEDAFVIYSLTGILPTLDWRLAFDLLLDIHRLKRDCTELKAMCVEYLGKNLSPDNIIGVMKMSCENNEEYLLSNCYEFLAKKCNIVPITDT